MKFKIHTFPARSIQGHVLEISCRAPVWWCRSPEILHPFQNNILAFLATMKTIASACNSCSSHNSPADPAVPNSRRPGARAPDSVAAVTSRSGGEIWRAARLPPPARMRASSHAHPHQPPRRLINQTQRKRRPANGETLRPRHAGWSRRPVTCHQTPYFPARQGIPRPRAGACVRACVPAWEAAWAGESERGVLLTETQAA